MMVGGQLGEGGNEKHGNYRLVTSVAGNLQRSNLRDKIDIHLEKQGPIRDSQHHFGLFQ